MEKKRVLAISGSTRKKSSQLDIIKAFAGFGARLFEVHIFEGVDTLPHFNPDLDNHEAPTAITHFRNRLSGADGILICTPEYAMGVPGSLKNALDWTVSSGEFSHKPVALITASSLGQKGHAALLETLRVIEAKITNDTQLLIPFIKTRLHADGQLTDQEVIHRLQVLVNRFNDLMTGVS